LGGVEGVAFVNTKYANISDDWPDFEIHMSSGSVTTDDGRGLRQFAGLTEEVKPFESLFKQQINKKKLMKKLKSYSRVLSHLSKHFSFWLKINLLFKSHSF
jgi:hypothetical protein